MSDQSADLAPDLETRLLGWTDPLHCLLLAHVEQHGNQGFGRENVRKYQLLDMIKARPIWRYEAAPGHEYDPTVLVTVLPDGRVWTAPLRSGDQLEPRLTIRRLPDAAAAKYMAEHADMLAGSKPGNHLVSGDTVGLDLTFDRFPDFIDTGHCRTEIESALLALFSRTGIILDRDSKNRLQLAFEYVAAENSELARIADYLPQYARNKQTLKQVHVMLRDSAVPYSTMKCAITLTKGTSGPRALDVLTATTLNEVLRMKRPKIEPIDQEAMQNLQQQQFQAIVDTLKAGSIQWLSGERAYVAGLGTSVWDEDACPVVETGCRSVNGMATPAAQAASFSAD